MRRQRPKGTTTREAVVDAALAVIDTGGVDRLTIRSVAKAAGAPPMSLYTHFTNKNELLELVYSEVSRRLYNDDAPGPTWQASLFAVCAHLREVLSEHPRWIPLLAQPSEPMAVHVRERVLKQMVDDGMTPDAAIGALASAMVTTIGLVLVDVTLRDADGTNAMTKRYERLRDWVEGERNGEHPVIQTAVSKVRRLNLEENFFVTIRSLIAGLDANRKHAG